MERDFVDLMRAAHFAARKHTGQRRKGRSGEPYINHPAEVARLLAEATGGRDRVLLIAALLHDTVEDTDATLEEIAAEFGDEVAALVAEVTDDMALHGDERKRRQVEHAPHASERAKRLKLADKTSNLRALADSPPADWSVARRRAYIEWTARVAEGCRGVDTRLEAWYDEAREAAIAALGSS